jgi:hypothetical protein
MNRIRCLAAVALVGAGILAGCGKPKPDPDVEQLKKDVKELQDEKQMLRDYLAKGGPLNLWLTYLAEAVCQLEVNNPAGLDNNKRICPQSPPHDIKPPPSYPK